MHCNFTCTNEYISFKRKCWNWNNNPESKLNVNVRSGGINGTVALRIGSVSNYPSLEFGIENDYDAMIKTFGNDLKIYAGNWRSIGAVATENHAIYFHTSKIGSPYWSIKLTTSLCFQIHSF
ncbi:hypothetical protein CPT03_16945 [Pedobacter ginsengisoli]|uniref:Uncharacterized protein n=1 Tax=Pedobacter ginsengisoli TaxID=363852 RepID=A0A2D1U8Y7_9SPHI|nr:hypothetical protein [Pedobacter ginsengisoli]ATP58032.1 hypothetical protein CPT03_16945 [Pedobacter ginsengisoli]